MQVCIIEVCTYAKCKYAKYKYARWNPVKYMFVTNYNLDERMQQRLSRKWALVYMHHMRIKYAYVNAYKHIIQIWQVNSQSLIKSGQLQKISLRCS